MAHIWKAENNPQGVVMSPGYHACWQAPLLMEPSLQPNSVFLYDICMHVCHRVFLF